jgi:hypothetical protein
MRSVPRRRQLQALGRDGRAQHREHTAADRLDRIVDHRLRGHHDDLRHRHPVADPLDQSQLRVAEPDRVEDEHVHRPGIGFHPLQRFRQRRRLRLDVRLAQQARQAVRGDRVARCDHDARSRRLASLRVHRRADCVRRRVG